MKFIILSLFLVSSHASASNDALFSKQHWINRLHLEQAWKLSTGSSDVKVAIFDSGVDLNHPDLKNRIAAGWNFYDDNHDFADLHGHGTHLAGIIGAEPNNWIGTTGINWNASILAYKTCETTSAHFSCPYDIAVKAVHAAVESGARIINISWGHDVDSDEFRAAADYAFDHGVLIICAAGNKAEDNDVRPHFPASTRSEGILSVANNSKFFQLQKHSNWGRLSVAMTAPATRALSTWKDGKWQRKSGTSMAAPMVAGIASLILSKEPKLFALDLRNALLNAVDVEPALVDKLATGGQINAEKALSQLDGGFQVWPAHYTVATGERFRFSTYHADGSKLSWSTSDPKVATIDQNGALTGQRIGSVVVTVSDENGHIAKTSSITILERPKVIRKGRADEFTL